MKSMIIGTTLLATVFMFGGCGNEVKSADYYKAHMDEAKEVKESCDKKISNGSIEANPANPSNELKNCMNASHALFVNGGLKTIKGNEKNIKTW